MPERPYVLWSDYVAVARRHVVLMAVLVLAGLGVGVAGAAVAPKTYQATAAVLVRPTGVGVNNPGADRAPAGVDLDTEAQLAVSERVLAVAAAQLGGARNLADRIDISVPPNSAILRFTFAAPTAREAADGANAIAAAYLADRRTGAEAARKAEIDRHRTAATELQAQLKKTPPAPTTGRSVDGPREVLMRRLSAELRKVDSLSGAPITPGRALDTARAPTNPIYPDEGVWATSGLSAGLLAAVAFGALRDRLSLRIKRRDDIVRLHGLRLYDALPADALRDERLGAAAFAHTATELLTALPPGERLITVTSPTTGAPTAAVTMAVGAALAHVGNEVLLVFTQVADAELATALGAGPAGLSAVVLDGADPGELARPVPGIERLRVLGPGADAVTAAERFIDPTDPTLNSLRAGVDYVLLAAGSALTTAEIGPLAARADGALIVVQLRRTTHGQLRRALRRLRLAQVLGAVSATRRRQPKLPQRTEPAPASISVRQ